MPIVHLDLKLQCYNQIYVTIVMPTHLLNELKEFQTLLKAVTTSKNANKKSNI